MAKNYRDTIDFVVEKMLQNVLTGNQLNAGHNGPYYDYEKRGRNISHWICIFSEYYFRTGNEQYKTAIALLADYYYEKTDYTAYGVYYCRDYGNKQKKDYVNGTIGQAWIIEGLVSAAKVLVDDSLYERARSMFKTLPFDKKNGMWERIEIDGRNLGLDVIYNHQLWYAAAGAEMIAYKYDAEIDEQIRQFLDRSMKTFWVMPNGVICHWANCYTDRKQKIKNIIKYWKHVVEIKCGMASLEYKEIGYHLFDMYGFALLQDRYSKHPFFKSRKFKSAIDYCVSDEYVNKLFGFSREKDGTHLVSDDKNVESDINTYAFPYNSPAFELPYISECFDLDAGELCSGFWNYQLEKTYDDTNHSFARNTEDVPVLNARIYELVRSNMFWEKR